MKYYYEPPEKWRITKAKTYTCDHPLYDRCTLYLKGHLGLAVIQARFNPSTKSLRWGPIDPWLIDELYSHDKWNEWFYQNCGACTDGLYPTVTVRQAMWAMRMKPLKRQDWEVFAK